MDGVVLSYRQRLYDRETLMLPNEPWNPAARLAQASARTAHACVRTDGTPWMCWHAPAIARKGTE